MYLRFKIYTIEIAERGTFPATMLDTGIIVNTLIRRGSVACYGLKFRNQDTGAWHSHRNKLSGPFCNVKSYILFRFRQMNNCSQMINHNVSRLHKWFLYQNVADPQFLVLLCSKMKQPFHLKECSIHRMRICGL